MVLAPCDRLHNTSGGSSDTELNELAVKPTSSPIALRAVTMVTPVANMPNASRNSRVEKLGGRARAGRGSERFTKAARAMAQGGMQLLSGAGRNGAVAGFPSAFLTWLFFLPSHCWALATLF